MKKICLMLALLLFLHVDARSDDVKCKIINYKEGLVYKIDTAMYKGTHIQLPERMMFPPQAGNSDLWTIEGNGHHIMVQPNSEEDKGARTNITVITESNTAYHFELRRVGFNEASSCVVIKDADKFFGGAAETSQSQGDKYAYTTPQEKQNMNLSSQISQLQKELQNEKKISNERIDGVLAKYRSMIYTRYEWTTGSGFKGQNLITDVWDDSRFTFIRVKADHRGLLAAKAEIDGKEEIIEYTPDSENVYKISGVYPKIFLRYGENNEVKVTRKDIQSNGVY